MSQDHSFSPRARHVELVQRNADVNRPREAEEFDPVYFCTEHELPVSPFLSLWINSNHTTIHQLKLQPSCSLLTGTRPIQSTCSLVPGMLGVEDTQQDAAHTPSLRSCRGIPIETARPRPHLPHRTSIPHTHPGIKGHDLHAHGSSFLPLHCWA